MRRTSALACGLVGLVLLAGCSESGPSGYRVSGEAKFNGTPIPYGEVTFYPDGSQQNSGPQGISMIHDGKFDTASSGGQAAAGGPTIVRVIGLTGPNGKPLCEYEYKVELPRQDSVLNIDVPASAAPKKAGTAPEI